MFKSGRWKNQNKIKIMFQLQFQATKVPKIKGKGLILALIPADTGKPVTKLKRVPIVDGTCTWEEQVYEMVKLVKDQKTERYKEKIYYFNMHTGSSKSRFVGEVGVDFANFVDINEPIQLSLPLTAANNGAILHVFVQKMQRTDEPRVFEENKSQLSESFRSNNQTSDCTENGNSNSVNKQRSSTDWSFGSRSDRSTVDIINSPDYNCTESSKNEVQVLKRRAELSELEIESLRKQVVNESKRSQELTRKMDEIREELNHEKSLNKELVKKMEGKDIEMSHYSESIDGLYARLEVERKEKEELKIHIEDMSLDYKYLVQENNDMDSKYLTTIKEYEEKLEKQRHEFEDDVQGLMNAKIEQEERVDQAEEALRKSTLTNADAVERLKDAHKQEVEKLFDQIDQQTEQIKQMSLELEASKEFNSLKKESTSWKSLMSEKNVMIRTLKSELKMVRGDYCGLKEKLSAIESEKDNLQKEVSKLEKKHQNLVKQSKVACDVTNGKHDDSKSNEGRCSESTHIFKHNDEQKLNHLLCELSSMDERNKDEHNDEQKLNHLLCELSSMDERNKDMENELKEMQDKYSDISLRFAEVESERQELVMTLRNLRNGKKK